MNLLKNSILVSNKTFFRSVAFKSAISLENLYPQSRLQITTPTKAISENKDEFTGYIPLDELDITYSKSSGPGGQNVNKVNTKVDIRFQLSNVKWLSENHKRKLAEKLQEKITKDGYLIFRSDLTRSQQLNVADCLEKIRRCVRQVVVDPVQLSEETLEKQRRRREKAARERLATKRHMSQLRNEKKVPEVIL